MGYTGTMKITRYPQSCLRIEEDGHVIVIDPGVNFLHTHQPQDLYDVEAALYTHEHSDHYEPTIANALLDRGIPLFANESTALLIGEQHCTIVRSGEPFTIAGFEITPIDLPHSLLPDGTPGPQNTAYLVNGMFLHPGDAKELAGASITASAMGLPITGPDISQMDAFAFAKAIGAEKAIAMHFDNHGANPQYYADAAAAKQMPFTLVVLADGESIEI